MKDFLVRLESIIQDRKKHQSPESYTASLFASGEDEIIKKVGEEAVEVVLAAKGQGKERLVSEVADLVYHTLILLAFHGLALSDIKSELERRHGNL